MRHKYFQIISVFIALICCVASAQNNSYFTAFPKTENPISEGNRWIVPGSTATQWGNVQTNGTMAFGVSLPTSFGDPTALLSGTWGPDQTAQGTIVVNTIPALGEVELRLRMTISASDIRGYELLCPTQNTPGYGVQIVRWNGPNGQFVYLPQTGNTAAHQCVNGDLIKATVTGTNPVTLNYYLNGSLFTSATDNGSAYSGPGGAAGPWTTGSPGIGFFDNQDNLWSRFGMDNFSASDGSSSVGILAPVRSGNWSTAGLPPIFPDGETTPNAWTPPTRTQCVNAACNTVSGGTVTAASINSAIAGAPAGTYVLVPAGTFTISSDIQMYGHNNVTLRGSGPASTILNLTGSVKFGAAFVGLNSGTLSASSYSSGTSSLTISSSTVPTVNDLAWFEQCDTGWSGATCATGSYADNGALFICGNNGVCDQNGGSSTHNYQMQLVWINSVISNGGNNYTIGFTPGLHMQNWSSSSSATLSWQSTTVVGVGMGLEEMTISGGSTSFQSSYACWMKGVRLITPAGNSAIGLSLDANTLIANNYIYANDSAASFSSDRLAIGQGSLQSGDSEDLILNNVIQSGFIEGGGSDEGVVIAYNYIRDSQNNFPQNSMFQHQPGSAFILTEGNQMGVSRDDDTWGTHTLNTWFRNYLSCSDPPYAGAMNNFEALRIDPFARFDNVIGNALGSSRCTIYESNGGFPTIFNFGTTASDPLAKSSAMRWGNCDTVNGNCRFVNSEVPTALTGNAAPFSNSVPASQALPASFFMPGSSAPAWWTVCSNWGGGFPTSCSATQTQPYPFAGPDVSSGPYVNTHANDIPAAIAFVNLPIDAARQISYSITSSSWSSGTETLNVTGLPGNEHVMGGFQISGAGACNSPTGGEFLILSSSSTQITYSLASNPGSCAGGSFKWPDMRQFDQRVYGASVIGGSPAVTLNPTSLTFGNQTVGTSSASQAITLTNSGTATLTITSITASGDFSQSNTCASTLGAGLNCTINVTFSPVAVGTRTGAITIVDNATGSPHSASLTGTGIAPIVSLTPSALSFPAQAVGSTSAPQIVTLTNTGNATLNITSIVATGDYARTTTCGATLAISASCTISVTFTPTTNGTRSGAITITDNAPGNPHVVGLSGTGFNPGIVISGNPTISGNVTISVVPVNIAPIMQIVPSSLAFGSVPVGNVSILSLTISNIGTAQMIFSSVIIGDTTDYSQTNNCVTLAVGASCTISVTFSPQSVGTLNSTISITANDSAIPHVVSMTGTGTAISGDIPLPTFTPTALLLVQAFVDPMAPFRQTIQQTVYVGNSTCPTAPARTNYKGVALGATVCDYVDSTTTALQTIINDWSGFASTGVCTGSGTFGADSRWDVIWTHGSTFAGKWTWCDKYNGTPTTKFIVFHSDTGNLRGRQVCSHGMQDVLTPPLPDAGYRNHGCQGFLGSPDPTVPLPVTNSAYTFDASYNDLANMVTLTSSVSAGSGTNIAMGTASTIGSAFSDCGELGTDTCPTDGVNHIAIQDARIMPASSVTSQLIPVSIKPAEWIAVGTVLSVHDLPAAPHDIGFDEDYFTADADEDGFGTNAIADMVRFACANCWFNHNYLDGIKRDGSEGHVLNLSDSPGPVQISHNWIEGNAVGLWGGGGSPPAVSGLLTTNVERRRNKLTYLSRWQPAPNGVQSIGKTVSAGMCSGGTLTLTIPNTGKFVISNLVVYPRAITGVTVTSQWYLATSVTSTTVTIPSTGCTGTTVAGGKLFGFASNVIVTSAAAMNTKANADPNDNNPVQKNRTENKEGQSTIVDGEICENSGADGQGGSCFVINIRACGGVSWCNGGQIFYIADYVLTNTIVRNSNQGIAISARSGGSSYGNWPITAITCAADGNSAAITSTGGNTNLTAPSTNQTVYGSDVYLTQIGNGVGSGIPLLATGFYATAYPTNGNYSNDSVITVKGTAICPANDTTSAGAIWGSESNNGGGVSFPGRRYVLQNLLMYNIGDHTKWDGSGAVNILSNGGGNTNFSVNMAVTQVSPVTIVTATITAIATCPVNHLCPLLLQSSTGDLAYIQCLTDSRFSSGPAGGKGAPMLSVSGDQLSFTYTPQNGSPALTLSDTTTCPLAPYDGSTADSGYYNPQGFPWPFYFNHNTAVGVNGFDIVAGNKFAGFNKSSTFTNSLHMTPGTGDVAPMNVVTPQTGGFMCPQDTYSATDASGITACYDRGTLTYQRYAIGARSIANHPNFLNGVTCAPTCSQDPSVNPGTNTTPARTSTPGTAVTCGGVPCDATHFIPDSVGFLGAMGTNNYPLALPDFRNYQLDNSSPYRAGGILQATDGKDMGVQMSVLLNAENRTLYVCGLPCGTGPFRDGPQYGFLVWNASSDPNHVNYRVYRNGAVSPTATITSTFYTDYGLPTGTNTWVVKDFNGTIETTVSGLTSTIF
jgi:hypothetical protein